MRNHFQKTAVVFVFSLFVSTLASADIPSGASERARGGDGVGNGGNFHELAFTDMAYEFYEALVEVRKKESLEVPVNLEKLKYVIGRMVVSDRTEILRLRGQEKHAINRPDILFVKYYRDEWKTATFLRRKQMVAHELLPMVGIADPGFHRALRLIRQVDRLALWQDPSESRLKVVTPLLLEPRERLFPPLSFSEAERACKTLQEQHRNNYFTIVCDIYTRIDEEADRHKQEIQNQMQVQEIFDTTGFSINVYGVRFLNPWP